MILQFVRLFILGSFALAMCSCRLSDNSISGEIGGPGDNPSSSPPVNESAPTLVINTTALKITELTNANFTFTAIDPDGDLDSMSCSLDGAPISNCATGVNYLGLSTGLHTLVVTAKDKKANQVQKTFSWHVTTTVSVAKAYPLNSNWNDFIKLNPDLGPYSQPDVTCDGTETTVGGCIHGAEKRIVDVSTEASCANLEAFDEADAFYWQCDDSSGHAIFYLLHLKERKGLKNLISTSGWKDQRLIVYKNSVPTYSSPFEAWWSNTVTAIDVASAVAPIDLNSSGSIYYPSSSPLAQPLTISASKMSFVVLEGDELESDWVNDITLTAPQFVWLEGDYDGVKITTATTSKHYTFKNLHMIGRKSVGGASIKLGGGRHLVTEAKLINSKYAIEIDCCAGFDTISDVVGADITLEFIEANITHDSNFIRVATYNTGIGVKVFDGLRSSIWGLTAVGAAMGIQFSATGKTTVANSFTYGGAMGLQFFGSGTQARIANFATSGAIFIGGSANSNGFFDALLIGDPSITCSLFSAGASPGLINSTCTTAGTEDSNVYAGQTSTALLRRDRDFSNYLLGSLTIEDSVNQSDVLGSRPYNDITDWKNFETPYRVWGDSSSTNCVPDLDCSIYDLRTNPLDNSAYNRTGNGRDPNWSFASNQICPSSVHGNRYTDDQKTTPNRFLTNAFEILRDGLGDDDGLCESSEACIYGPNFGSYQGEGDYYTAGTCSFVDGAIASVKMYAFPQNGEDYCNSARIADSPYANSNSSGDGLSEATAYRICTAEQFNSIGINSADWDKHFVLMSDIDLGEFTGTQYNYIGEYSGTRFTGVFDGNGHVLSNLNYTAVTPLAWIGLFGSVGAGGVVKNLGVRNVNLVAPSIQNMAAIAGSNFGTITRVFATGQINGGNSAGIVSKNSGDISHAYADVEIISPGLGNNSAGLVGDNSGTVLNSLATGDVEGAFHVGGFVGMNGGTIQNCYSTGNVIGANYTGGFVGFLVSGSISNSFSTGSVDGNSGTKTGWFGGFFGVLPTNSWYWSGTTCSGGAACITTGTSAKATLTDFNIKTNAPLSSWDFARDWINNSATPPGLR